MIEDTPTIVDVILEGIDSRLLDVHTALPCRVESYDAVAGTVDVVPAISRVLLDEAGERVLEVLPKIVGVPVMFPGSGGFSVTFPIAAGDHVLVVFSETSIGEWFHSGASDPMDERRHSLAGAIAIPGIRSASGASPDATTDKIVLGGGPVYLGSKNAAEAMVKGTTLMNWLMQVYAWGTTHTHPETGTTTGPSALPTPFPTVPTITSSQHKLDT